MFAMFSATEVAFALAALMQAVLGVVWLVGAWWAAETRRASLQWAAYAGWSALSFVLLSAAMRSAELHPADASRAELLRAAGNVCGVVALLALRAGVWRFLGRVSRPWLHPLLLAAVLAVAWIGLDPAFGALRVGFNSLLLAGLCIDIGRALYLHARDTLRQRHPWLMSLPVLLAAVGYAQRGAQAIADPALVMATMTTHSALNVGSVFLYVVLSLAFHAMLTALVVARLMARLNRLARRDGLTGLLNRRAMQEALDGQLRRSQRSGEASVVMMVDADHFKRINDHHGHAVGDLALKHLSTLLRANVREIDRLARFGGEEFLVLLPGLALGAALPMAERLRAHVAATPLVDGERRIPLSISIGIAQWHGAAEELSPLLVRADAALYQAKQHGRDRVASAPQIGGLLVAT